MHSLEEALQLIHSTQTRTALAKYDQYRCTKCLRANRIAYADKMSYAIRLYEQSAHEVACRATQYTYVAIEASQRRIKAREHLNWVLLIHMLSRL